jgi:hypothetical protein
VRGRRGAAGLRGARNLRDGAGARRLTA